jgi:polysaccharide deacetylase family protein (PEP-CTERM system associated)
MNAFTVDVEDWFHICGVEGELAADRWAALPARVEFTTDRLLHELEAAGVLGTFFVLGWVAERYPALVQRIKAAGHAVASHGHMHLRAHELGRDRFAADVASSVRALSNAGADRVTAFRAPEWSLNSATAWGFEVLSEQGFTTDASMAPVRLVGDPAYPRTPHRRQVANGSIVEVPPFVVDRWGNAMPLGWGWALRYSRPRTVIRAIERANREGRPAVLTVHPWEIDPDPPRVRLPPRLYFSHYFQLDGFLDRLRTVLRHVPFTSLGAVASAAPPL